MRRSYGSFENQIVKLNHSLEKDPSSKKHSFYWYYEGSFKPVHNYRSFELNIKVMTIKLSHRLFSDSRASQDAFKKFWKHFGTTLRQHFRMPSLSSKHYF